MPQANHTDPQRWLGIDPGQSGGIAWIDEDGPHAIPMPATERDVWEVIVLLEDWATFALIETVHSMPKQGVASSFKFGQSYGMLRMALIASGIPFAGITPQKWQGPLGLKRTSKDETITAKKNRHKARAQELFPSLKITHKIADALLLAYTASRDFTS